MMRRREFITVLGGAAAAWPIAAGAQQAERMRRIGVLAARSADDPEWQARMAAFRQGLQELGWIGGRTIEIEHRVGPDDNEFCAGARRSWSRWHRMPSWSMETRR